MSVFEPQTLSFIHFKKWILTIRQKIIALFGPHTTQKEIEKNKEENNESLWKDLNSNHQTVLFGKFFGYMMEKESGKKRKTCSHFKNYLYDIYSMKN